MRDPFMEALGLKVLHLAPGEAAVAGEVRADHLNLHGTAHGGFLYALAHGLLPAPWGGGAGGGEGGGGEPLPAHGHLPGGGGLRRQARGPLHGNGLSLGR